MATPSNEVLFREYVYIDYEVKVQGRNLLGDFRNSIGFNMILDMDWLSRLLAIIDFWNKIMVFRLDEETKFAFHGDGLSSISRILSAITRKMVQKGIQGFLAYMQDMSMEVLKMEQVSIVKEFIDVLPNDLPGLHSSREIEFCIDLVRF